MDLTKSLIGGWVLLAVLCELYIKYKVIDNDGHTHWPDDESKGMAKQYTKYANDENSDNRRCIRVTYLVVPPFLATFFIFLI